MNQADKKKLEQYVQRVANLETKKKEIGEEIKELCGEANVKLGIDQKTVKRLAKERNMTEVERQAQRLIEEELDECRAALGMLVDLPLGEAAQERVASAH